jgi:hypothetical protein
MRAQVLRVAEAWDLLESSLLVGKQSDIAHPTDPNREAFQARGLKKEWLNFMQKEYKEQLDKLQGTLDKKVQIFYNNPSVITKLKRWDYSHIFGRAVKVPDCGTEPDSKKMQQRVDLLKDAYKKMDRVNSDLKFD